MEKYILINQIVHFTRMVLHEVESENDDKNIQLVLMTPNRAPLQMSL